MNISLWILDLFCCQGGCTAGYQRAGFKVRGVDINCQPRYVGEESVQADALEYLSGLIESGGINQFSAIHASPPCQKFSKTAAIHKHKAWRKSHPDLVAATRNLLQASGLPYVIENVEGAPLNNLPMFGSYRITLCGTMFGLSVYRHRLFESNVPLTAPVCGDHSESTGAHRGFSKGNGFICVAGHNFNVSDARRAMGIDWMNQQGLAQAIPPAYCEFIGKQLMNVIQRQQAFNFTEAA